MHKARLRHACARLPCRSRLPLLHGRRHMRAAHGHAAPAVPGQAALWQQHGSRGPLRQRSVGPGRRGGGDLWPCGLKAKTHARTKACPA